MAVRYGPTKLRVPNGFQSILEGLAREVLREQPTDIVNFAAQHFRHLLELKNDPDAKMGNLFSKRSRQANSNEGFKSYVKSEEGPTNDNDEYDVINDKDSDDVMRQNGAAVKIQSGYRGHQARKRVKGIRESQSTRLNGNHKTSDTESQREKDLAAARIQAGYRGHKARNQVKEMREEQAKKETSHEIIQGDEREAIAATKIQAGYRGYKTRKDMRSKSEEGQLDTSTFNNYNDEQIKAATKIQAGYRGYKTRSNMQGSHLNHESDNKQSEQDLAKSYSQDEALAATKIQAGYRGYKTRKNMRSSSSHENDNDDQEAAAIKIQAGYRGYQTRKELKKNKEIEEEEMGRAATKIQANFRGQKTRKELNAKGSNTQIDDPRSNEYPINEAEDSRELDLAATKIQAGFRGHKTRKELKVRESKTQSEVSSAMNTTDDETLNRDHHRAAIKIQANYRGYATRKEMRTKKEKTKSNTSIDGDLESSISVDRLHDNEDRDLDKAATRIQANYRGYATRKHMNRSDRKVEEENHSNLDDMRNDRSEESIGVTTNERDLDQAASKIQAGYRGYATRKQMRERQKQNSEENIHENTDENDIGKLSHENATDERDRAAAKIQAGYRGYATRKQMKNKANDDGKYDVDVNQNESDSIFDLNDPEMNKAATTIQSRYKGYRVRKGMNERI